MKKQILATLAVSAAVFGVGLIGAGEVSATSIPVNSGMTTPTIQSAIDGAGSGDVVEFAAGTYNLTDFLDINGKTDLTLTGAPGVILKYDGQTATTSGIRQAIRVLDSENITVENIEIQAASPTNEATFSTASSGIGINSSCDIILRELSISGFGGYGGIMVTRLADAGPHPCPAGDITFDTLTLTNNKTGIFFTDGAVTPSNVEIVGVVFEGVNTITTDGGFDENTAIGSYSVGGVGVDVFGPDGLRLNVGHLVASGYEDHYWFRVKSQVALIKSGSTLDGVLVEDMDPYDLGTNHCFRLVNDLGEDECPDGYMLDGDGRCVPKPCDPNDPSDPRYPCITVPDTGFMGGIGDIIGSNIVLVAAVGGSGVVAVFMAVRWARRFHRIRL